MASEGKADGGSGSSGVSDAINDDSVFNWCRKHTAELFDWHSDSVVEIPASASREEAYETLAENGILSAPVWDERKKSYSGMVRWRRGVAPPIPWGSGGQDTAMCSCGTMTRTAPLPPAGRPQRAWTAADSHVQATTSVKRRRRARPGRRRCETPRGVAAGSALTHAAPQCSSVSMVAYRPCAVLLLVRRWT